MLMAHEPKITSRVRQQTAVLLTAIAATVQKMEKQMSPISFETLSTDPDWIKHRNDLEFNKQLLMTTTDQHGTHKVKKLKPQGSRLIKVGCPHCGYSTRISAMWITCAVPVCPNPYCEHKGKPFEVNDVNLDIDAEVFQPLVAKVNVVSSISPEDEKRWQEILAESEEFLSKPLPVPAKKVLPTTKGKRK